MERKITLDFTATNAVSNQELAIMPVGIAKKLLMAMASNLVNVRESDIVHDFKLEIDNCYTVQQALDASLEFINMRSLIDNCAAGNWDAYAVETESEPKGDLVHVPVYDRSINEL
jgi:hypothetical protein